MSAFKPVPSEVSFPREEEEVLALWQRHDAFRRSVEERPADSRFIFYDGPPFATGLPHYGHLVASTLKDIVPRYWTMKGHRVERRFGWDTHGLPIEMDVEKKLNLSGPSSIREYGVAEFNEQCRAGVLRYVAEWEKTITRIGRWVDFKNDYKTMDTPFMESVWWVFKRLFEQGLVYRGLRVTPFSWRLSTPLSNFEAGLDYRDVDDPALTLRFELLGREKEYLLVWTTTPWTLPSNLAVAVGAELDYVKVQHEDGNTYWVAQALKAALLGEETPVLETKKGSELVGLKYRPLFPYFASHPHSFRVIASGHVTTTDGTGLVHMAPAFGEDDFEACRREGIAVIDPVDDEGRFKKEVPDYAGKNIKEADKDIIRDLKARHVIFKHATIKHAYPYCWRSGTPLIYKTTPSWYVKVEALRERMVAHNQDIHWVPEFVGQARFANWLKEARDWSISRSRFWGTPLPIWESEDGELVCIGSVEDLEKLTGEKVTDLHPHRIDHLTFTQNGKQFRRVRDVFDCWFESGAMPYAQSHYPFENKAAFEADFPAHFIAEGLDQTRGWFYTLMVLSTALFDKAPFRNVIVNGLVLAEDGAKMSKSKQNYPDPALILNGIGADALRAYLISSPVVRAEPLRFSEAGVKDVVRTVLLPLQNALSFFVTYANVEGWDPKVEMAKAPKLAERPELDRWLLSGLQSLVREVNTQMEGYYLYKVVPPMLAFIDDLTNWYIRRSRRRFSRNESKVDQQSAFATLYEVLVTFGQVLAPVMPFMSERLYQRLVVEPGVAGAKDSVHLCDYPTFDATKVDANVEAAMAAVRAAVGAGRILREKHKLKTRQPLRRVTVVSHDDATRAHLEHHAALLAEELNVKQVTVVKDDASLASLSFKPNFKTLGKRLGPKLKTVGKAIEGLSREDWAKLEAGHMLTLDGESLGKEDVLVSRSAKGDVVLETVGELTVALDTALDDALKKEGLLREALRCVQQARQATDGLEVSHAISLHVMTASASVLELLKTNEATLRDEGQVTGTLELVAAGAPGEGWAGPHAFDVEGQQVVFHVKRA